MRFALLATLALACLLPARTSADQPHYFMLLEPGNERWYQGSSMSGPVNIHTLVTHYEGDVSIMLVERLSPYPATWIEAWFMDDTGDVWSCDPDDHSSRALFLDMPLTCVQVDWRHWDPGYPTEHSGYYRFNDGHGFIEYLYFDGYHVFQHYGVVEAVIAVENRSWSQVKELFR